MGTSSPTAGCPMPKKRLVKATLTIEIGTHHCPTQAHPGSGGHAHGDLSPRFSHPLHGRLSCFSAEQLMGFLTALGSDVEIVVGTPPRCRRGPLRWWLSGGSENSRPGR